MSALRLATTLILWTLSAAGLYLTIGVAIRNGTIPSIQRILKQGVIHLPDQDLPLQDTFTGIHAIDQHLQSAVLVFGVASSSSNASSLTWWSLAAELQLVWTVILLKGRRVSHGIKFLAQSVLVGILMHNVSYACVLPAWCALHLHDRTRTSKNNASQRKPADLYALPLAVFLGFTAPLALWVLPDSILDPRHRRLAIALWQFWPVYTVVLQAIFSTILTRLLGSAPSSSDHVRRKWATRTVYAAAMAQAYCIQMAARYTGDIETSNSQELLAKFQDGGLWSLVKHFSFINLPNRDFADGVQLLIRLDSIVGGMAFHVWSIYSHRTRVPTWLLVAVSSGFLLKYPTLSAVRDSVILLWLNDELEGTW